MKIGIRLLPAALVMTSVGCQPLTINYVKPHDTSAASQRPLLIGRWYGEQPMKEGGRRVQITEHCPDGTLTIGFHVVESSGNLRDQTEVGWWGVSGSIYFTIIRGWLRGGRVAPADPTD